jgi:hypothetical protein
VEAPMVEAGAPTPSPVEEPKIIPTEEKIQLKPKEIQPREVQPPEVQPITQLPITELPSECPVIIHKEAEFKPISETKKSLGGLFGFLRKSKKEEEKISPVKAQVEMGIEHEITRKESPRPSAEPPKARVVHYTEFPTPVSPFPTEERKDERPAEEIPRESALSPRESALGEIKPPENLPAEPPKVEEKKPEEKPVAEEVEPPKTEPVLDLRKPPEESRPLPEKPPTGPAKPEEEIIDLSSFR